MKRRSFLRTASSAAIAFPLSSSIAHATSATASPTQDLLEQWIGENDQRIDEILRSQEKRSGHPSRGGFANVHGIYMAGSAAGQTARLVSGYASPRSRHHQSEQVAESLNLAVEYLLRVQHDDGTIDLLTTNFHSTPDTGFVVEPLALALSVTRLHCPQRLPIFQELCEQFLNRAGKALSSGGIHTPNHRWVVCMALAWINHLLPKPGLVARIDRWLKEQIDIDQDGQYTERSIAVYSPLVDRCLITIARLLGRDELYEPVRRNLRLTPYFLHANGELATEASRRQDQYQIAKPTPYYYPYRYMALLDDDGQFAAMAQKIETETDQRTLSGDIPRWLDDTTLSRPLPASGKLPANYEKLFAGSQLARIRRQSVDATILAGNNTFFTFFRGNAALQAVRFASAFFGKGQFIGSKLEVRDGAYVLQQQLHGPYYQPIPDALISQDGVWDKMPREARPQSEVMVLNSTVTVRERGGSFTIDIQVDGTDHVPLAIELAFRPGGKLDGVAPILDVADAYLLASKQGCYSVGNDSIRFGPGRARHRWTQLRGAEPKLQADCVYLTDYTPFRFQLTIE